MKPNPIVVKFDCFDGFSVQEIKIMHRIKFGEIYSFIFIKELSRPTYMNLAVKIEDILEFHL